jgi:signal transduction histidine kinase
MLRRDLGYVRDVISQLRPAVMDQGLDAALQETAERLRRLTDVTVTTDLQGTDDGLDERQRTVVLRIAQEALHNVRKHAGASAVSVSTSRTDDDWSLEIRDDGRGFDVGAVAARGRQNFGLQFMRERAELIGARFDVRSRPDGGTVVRLVIPTSAHDGAEESR